MTKRDIISFLIGIIVSGYVVEISLFPDFNIYYLITILCGIIIGLLSYFLNSTIKKFEECVISFKINRPDSTIAENQQQAWETINSNVIKRNSKPKVLVPFLVIMSLIFFITGIVYLNKGRDVSYNKIYSDNKKQQLEMQNSLIPIIDSITTKNSEQIKFVNSQLNHIGNQIDTLLEQKVTTKK